jgi:hypothetical protein
MVHKANSVNFLFKNVYNPTVHKEISWKLFNSLKKVNLRLKKLGIPVNKRSLLFNIEYLTHFKLNLDEDMVPPPIQNDIPDIPDIDKDDRDIYLTLQTGPDITMNLKKANFYDIFDRISELFSESNHFLFEMVKPKRRELVISIRRKKNIRQLFGNKPDPNVKNGLKYKKEHKNEDGDASCIINHSAGDNTEFIFTGNFKKIFIYNIIRKHLYLLQ